VLSRYHTIGGFKLSKVIQRRDYSFAHSLLQFQKTQNRRLIAARSSDGRPPTAIDPGRPCPANVPEQHAES